MPRHLSPLFKTRYRELLRDVTSTGFMPFSMFSMEPVRMKQHGCMEIRPEPLHTGFIDWSLADSRGWLIAIDRDARPGSLLPNWRVCAMTYDVLPENWDTLKTSGMDCCCLTISRNNTPFLLVCGNAKGSFTSSVLVSRDLVARPAKPIPSSRSPSKKLLPMDEGSHHPALVRGRSPFSATQQPDTDVGTERTAATCTLTFGPSQGGFLWGTQLENRLSYYSRSSRLQCQDLWRLYSLSSSIYARKTLPYLGQCPMAQIKRSQRILGGKPGSSGTYFPTTILSGTQSHRTSMEGHSPASNTQPLFPIDRRSQVCLNISICKMEPTKQCS
jgi:hypothetical protein